MIKTITFRIVPLLLILLSCDNEPYEGEINPGPNSCELAIENTNEALENFNQSSSDTYNLRCQEYRNALNRQILFCGDEDGELQGFINNLGICEIDNSNLCEEATEATLTAQINYEAADELNFETLCESYKSALEYQIEVCGDNDSLQNILDEIGSCELEQVEVAGTWKLVSWNTDEPRDLDNDGTVTNNYLDEIDCYDNETILFNADGTGTMFLRSTAEFSFTPTENGEDFFIVCNTLNEDKSFTWTETINNVILLFDDGTSISLFKNGGLYIAIDDAFIANSTVDNSIITERIIFGYIKL